MNERFNPFRSVEREEVEGDHTFRTLRHFPTISKSMKASRTSVNMLLATSTPALLTGTANSSSSPCKTRKSTNPKKLKSTHRLDELCQSSLSEFQTLSQFRYQIINERKKSQSVAQTHTSPRSQASAVDPLVSGNEKLTKFAVRYDSRRMNNDLDGFHERILDKAYFDYQLKRCLCIYLTPEELDAVFTSIDADRSGLIDGVEFLRYFFKLGMTARDQIRLQVIKDSHEIEEKRKQLELEERKMMFEENLRLKVEFTEEDRESAMKKMTRAASQFEGNSTSVEFADIVGIRLTPFEFKLFLEKTFALRLSPPETAALLDQFATFRPSTPGSSPNLHPTLQHSLSTSSASNRPLWCHVDGRQFISTFLLLKEQEASKQKAILAQYAERRNKVQYDLGATIELFPKQLGR